MPPSDYLLTINVLGVDRCYLGLETNPDFIYNMFVFGESFLRSFILIFYFDYEMLGFLPVNNLEGGSVKRVWSKTEIFLAIFFLIGVFISCTSRHRTAGIFM